MRWVFFILLFLFLGAFLIVSSENLTLSKKDDFSKFYSSYYSWLSGLASNLKTSTAYVVKLDWFPENTQNITK